MFNPHDYLDLASDVFKIADSEAEWETKYNLIFSSYVGALHDLYPLSYYDPDTSYEEDVRAYVDALRDKVEDIKRAYRL